MVVYDGNESSLAPFDKMDPESKLLKTLSESYNINYVQIKHNSLDLNVVILLKLICQKSFQAMRFVMIPLPFLSSKAPHQSHNSC